MRENHKLNNIDKKSNIIIRIFFIKLYCGLRGAMLLFDCESTIFVWLITMP